MAELVKLKATKNGRVKYFTLKQWSVLGTDKYGWILEPEIPKEVAAIASKPQTVANIAEILSPEMPQPAAKRGRKPSKK